MKKLDIPEIFPKFVCCIFFTNYILLFVYYITKLIMYI